MSQMKSESRLIALAVFASCLIANAWANRNGWLPDNFELGGEYARIAFAVLDGRGYADAFIHGGGPTGWMPPVYVALLAVVKYLIGGSPGTWSSEGMLVLVGFKCAVLAWGAGLTNSTLRLLQFPRPVRLAVAPAWLIMGVFANWLLLTSGTHDSWWLAWVLMLGLHGVVAIGRSRYHPTLCAGLVLAALSSPVLFASLLAILMLRALSFPRRWLLSRGLVPILPAVAAGLLTLCGWILHVHANTGIWAPGKTNGSFELWQSLNRTGNGVVTASTARWHPINNASMQAEYRQLGEKAFLEHYADEGIKSLRHHPERLVRHILGRAFNAFVAMSMEGDTLYVNLPVDAVPETQIAELYRARLIAFPQPQNHQLLFLYMGMSDAELSDFAPDLSSEARATWQIARQLFQEKINGIDPAHIVQLRLWLQSGATSLLWGVTLLALGKKQRRRLLIPLACYLFVLGPYVLISHYARYQASLMHLQVLVWAVAIGVTITGCKRRLSPTHQHVATSRPCTPSNLP